MHAAATSEMYLKQKGLAYATLSSPALRGENLPIVPSLFGSREENHFEGGNNEQYPRSCLKEPSWSQNVQMSWAYILIGSCHFVTLGPFLPDPSHHEQQLRLQMEKLNSISIPHAILVVQDSSFCAMTEI